MGGNPYILVTLHGSRTSLQTIYHLCVIYKHLTYLEFLVIGIYVYYRL